MISQLSTHRVACAQASNRSAPHRGSAVATAHGLQHVAAPFTTGPGKGLKRRGTYEPTSKDEPAPKRTLASRVDVTQPFGPLSPPEQLLQALHGAPEDFWLALARIPGLPVGLPVRSPATSARPADASQPLRTSVAQGRQRTVIDSPRKFADWVDSLSFNDLEELPARLHSLPPHDKLTAVTDFATKHDRTIDRSFSADQIANGFRKRYFQVRPSNDPKAERLVNTARIVEFVEGLGEGALQILSMEQVLDAMLLQKPPERASLACFKLAFRQLLQQRLVQPQAAG
ncbi:MAG: hypothetical protein JWQ11_3879 [Rhizobacter sp.]|nr:hypothetical protein [Rhizobacter sp.]